MKARKDNIFRAHLGIEVRYSNHEEIIIVDGSESLPMSLVLSYSYKLVCITANSVQILSPVEICSISLGLSILSTYNTDVFLTPLQLIT